MIDRRGLLGGLLAAPVIIRTPGLLMPIPRRIKLPEWTGPVEPPVKPWSGTMGQQSGFIEVHQNQIFYRQNSSRNWYPLGRVEQLG